jgi:hypothetical protein
MNAAEDPREPLPIDLMQQTGHNTVRQNLHTLGTLLIKKYYSLIPTLMMDWSNPRQEADRDPLPGPERAVKGLRNVAAYLAEEAKQGRIRQSNFEVLAQTFVGACWHYAFLQVMLGAWHQKPISQEEYLDDLVTTLWDGIAPEG